MLKSNLEKLNAYSLMESKDRKDRLSRMIALWQEHLMAFLLEIMDIVPDWWKVYGYRLTSITEEIDEYHYGHYGFEWVEGLLRKKKENPQAKEGECCLRPLVNRVWKLSSQGIGLLTAVTMRWSAR